VRSTRQSGRDVRRQVIHTARLTGHSDGLLVVSAVAGMIDAFAPGGVSVRLADLLVQTMCMTDRAVDHGGVPRGDER
jgi:hypothetical protein